MVEVHGTAAQTLPDYRAVGSSRLSRLRPVDEILIMKGVCRQQPVPLGIFKDASVQVCWSGAERPEQRRFRDDVLLRLEAAFNE